MSKLGNKETILILVVINFMCYYLLFMMGVNPIKATIQENKTQIETLQAEYDEKKEIVDSEQQYRDDIERLKAEKVELFATGFPNTNPESLHAFMNKELQANSVTISNINIAQAPRKVNADGGERETGIFDNTITIVATGGYSNVTKFIETVENLEKTSLLTSLSLSGNAAEMQTNIQYSFLSADKTETPDDIFDHQFGQAAGNSALFK